MDDSIRFRAWDIKNKKYYYFNDLCMMYLDDLGGVGGIIMASHNFYKEELSEEGYEWEQFTGVYGKDGRDVFVGDIIRQEWFALGKKTEIVFVVVADPLVRLKKVKYRTDRGNIAILENERFRDISWITEKYEIIGNIRMNPELIE